MSEPVNPQPAPQPEMRTAEPGPVSRFVHEVEGVAAGARHAIAGTAAIVSKADATLRADLQDHTGTAFSLYEDVLAAVKNVSPEAAAEISALLPKVLVVAASAARITSGVLAAV
jgi:hypothetical protein